MAIYRNLSETEIKQLEAQSCTAQDWTRIKVKEGFNASYVCHTRFSGEIKLGVFEKEFELPGGIIKHSGIHFATLHNVEIGDNCSIENVKNYIANYKIGNDSFIENVDIIFVEGTSSFGNGVEVCVLNETGGREVMIYDRLSAQMAYILALYRYRNAVVENISKMIADYTQKHSSDRGYIGCNSRVVDAGYIKNVRIGDFCRIEGTSRLKNGSLNSTMEAPIHIGVGVIGDDFIVCGGTKIEDGVMFSRCFIGEACKLGHGYSATDSLFFSNCQGENGEACAIFAGPFTVTHHKSSLLIAGMFSFMNAGSGSNQSNHMYKLGPIHQGIMERGAKTSSDSYILWPARVGAFSLVMGRHTNHQDTSNLPFSYLIEEQSTSYIVPGANLKSVGTIRDAKKWPKRDGRTWKDKLDLINYNLLSPYTIGKMIKGRILLKEIKNISGENTDTYTYQNGKIRKSSLENGLKYYSMVIDKFLGNSLISRIQKYQATDLESIRKALKPSSDIGRGKWIDVGGLIAPKQEIDNLLNDIEMKRVKDVDTINSRLAEMHNNYYDYEWTWAFDAIQSYYDTDLLNCGIETLIGLIQKWKESVVTLDYLLIEDARKEFSLSAMTSFGADGDKEERIADFENVRGASFENDPFVQSIRQHIKQKNTLGEDMIELLDNIY